MHSIHSLAEDFRNLGIRAGDTVMLHASVRAVGEVAGGPDSIHLALKQALTGTGTLLMYASCPRYYDEIGRGTLSADEEAALRTTLPPFDPLTARSDRENGTLVEFFRTYPGSSVNPHVARFVAWGAQAESLLIHHPWNYPFGRGSALERLRDRNGKILLLGSDLDAVTYLHYVEHTADFPNKIIARYDVPLLEQGRCVWKECEEVDTSGAGAHPNWPDRFFETIVSGFLQASANGAGQVGDAKTFLIPARALGDYAERIMLLTASGEN